MLPLRSRRREVALVGFDDFELADLLATTVVRYDAQRLGAEAAQLAAAYAASLRAALPER